MQYATVAVARPLGGELTYAIPAHLGEVRVGHVVLVPLGRQSETGYVVGLTDTPAFDPAKIKPISRLLDPVPAFDDDQLAFLRWAANYYLAPLGMVLASALPREIRAKVMRVLTATEQGVLALTQGTVEGQQLHVLREVIARPGLTRRGLIRRLAQELDKDEVKRSLTQLSRKGLAAWSDKQVREMSGKTKTVTLVEGHDEPARMGKRMKALVADLTQAGGPVDLADLLSNHGGHARRALASLEAAGVVRSGTRERRDLLDDAPALGAKHPPTLNRHQQAALEALTQPHATGPYLLYGVTGSGKTEVFLGAARATLDRGQQVLVMVPEIGLTPQLVGRFKARFGGGVAVLHSGLTGAQRLAAWRRIRAGECPVAVGARSALFAPFRSLGLIVVDEEHDDSYKQDEGVTYNARDLAVVLGKRQDCPVILASATPALETWHNAQQGRYVMLELPERATPRPVPRVNVVDLTKIEVAEGEERPLLAPEVVKALRDTFDRGGQGIVLYNRRGFATVVQCTACGAAYECPNCGISMTLHKRIGRLTCHYCSLSLPYGDRCAVCQAQALEESGKGTEQIEERLQELFPEVAIARMDADTTATRGAHHRILSAFREGRTQLLIGTQIVAKGHDFPGVHTAVVVSADHGFRMPDFRAAERTYALLVQLAGRAGRGDVAGEVFVQTWKPDHYVLSNLDDMRKFYAQEQRLRSTLHYPPYSRLCLVRISGVDRRETLMAAETLGRALRADARSAPGVRVLGPAPAALPRLVGRWRFQVIIRGAQLRPLRAFLRSQLSNLKAASRKGVRVHWDVDPRRLM